VEPQRPRLHDHGVVEASGREARENRGILHEEPDAGIREDSRVLRKISVERLPHPVPIHDVDDLESLMAPQRVRGEACAEAQEERAAGTLCEEEREVRADSPRRGFVAGGPRHSNAGGRG
jgi:hypothetical protein